MAYIRTKTDYCIVGADYSAQEPRLLAHLSGDKHLAELFAEGKDIYALIGMKVLKKSYWECSEKYEDGTSNPEGAKIRKKCKTLVLGISYGMGSKKMAEDLHVDIEECKKILKDFFDTFPAIQPFTNNNLYNAKNRGYVEDYMGRRRHLPDAALDELDIKCYSKVISNEDVFLDKDSFVELSLLDADNTKKWKNTYSSSFEGKGFEYKNQFKDLAKEAGVSILDNGAFISKTMTQSTNATIQGSAATLTKKAMIAIHNNKRLNELGFRLLIPVHDELLGECPTENRKEVERLLSETMIRAALPECAVNMETDTYVVSHWYLNELSDDLHDKFLSLDSDEERHAYIKSMQDKYSAFSNKCIEEMCLGTYDLIHGGL